MLLSLVCRRPWLGHRVASCHVQGLSQHLCTRPVVACLLSSLPLSQHFAMDSQLALQLADEAKEAASSHGKLLFHVTECCVG